MKKTCVDFDRRKGEKVRKHLFYRSKLEGESFLAVSVDECLAREKGNWLGYSIFRKLQHMNEAIFSMRYVIMCAENWLKFQLGTLIV
jgi:hypothetical protein